MRTTRLLTDGGGFLHGAPLTEPLFHSTSFHGTPSFMDPFRAPPPLTLNPFMEPLAKDGTPTKDDTAPLLRMTPYAKYGTAC